MSLISNPLHSTRAPNITAFEGTKSFILSFQRLQMVNRGGAKWKGKRERILLSTIDNELHINHEI